jgi:hypothetical protein
MLWKGEGWLWLFWNNCATLCRMCEWHFENGFKTTFICSSSKSVSYCWSWHRSLGNITEHHKGQSPLSDSNLNFFNPDLNTGPPEYEAEVPITRTRLFLESTSLFTQNQPRIFLCLSALTKCVSYPVVTGGDLFPRWLKRPEREAYHYPPTSAKVMKTWIYASTHACVFMA